MNLIIRPERITDYHQIAEVNLLAFRKNQDFIREPSLADTLRHRQGFDGEFAIVAELDNRIVGYALFSPCEAYFLGEPTRVVFLAPLAVHPDLQKRGIGGALLKEGHRLALEKGYAASLLYGSDLYYPRHGYRINAFSGRGLAITPADLPACTGGVVERLLQPSDLQSLTSMWRAWHREEPVALFPGHSLLDWESHHESIRASAVEVDGQLAGYIRYRTDLPHVVLSFLASDATAANRLLGYLGSKLNDQNESLRLPINPESPFVQSMLQMPYTSIINMSVHAMLNPLDGNRVGLAGYLRHLEQGGQGVLNLPAQLEWC